MNRAYLFLLIPSVIPTLLYVISVLLYVIPAPLYVIPAKAGIHLFLSPHISSPFLSFLSFPPSYMSFPRKRESIFVIPREQSNLAPAKAGGSNLCSQYTMQHKRIACYFKIKKYFFTKKRISQTFIEY